MGNKNTYIGGELELFSKATNWKKYFSSIIQPYIKGDVLEVGAGTGNNTAYINKNPSITTWTAIEPDPGFYQLLKTRGHNVIEGNIKAITGNNLFDTIIYIDVLEHIEHDADEIKRASGLLRQNGHLVILSPAHNYLFSKFDKAIGHYRRYNKKSLSKTIASTSLKKIKLLYLDSLGTLLSLGNKLFTKQKYPTPAQVNMWDTYFVRISRITDKLFFHHIGKSIVGVWKKQ